MLHTLFVLGLLASPEMYGGNLMYPDQEDWASGGLATGDLNLDAGGYQLILDDGATGAGNLSVYFGADTDLGFYRAGANQVVWDATTFTINGSTLVLTAGMDLTMTGAGAYAYNTNGDLQFGAACDAAGTTGNVCVGGALFTVDNESQLDGNVYVGGGNFVALDSGKFYPDKDDASVSVTTTGVGVLDLNGTPLFDNYTRHHDVPIGAAIVGATAPGVETIGTFRCVVFDANADLAYINVEVPTEWNGASDMAIDLLIFADDGDALGNGEVIEFDLVYRSVAVGEAYDNGTAVTINANVTGGASEVDKGQYKITATVDYDDTDQPLAVNDTLGFSIMRDVTTGDTYSGDVHVCRAQLVYQANALATH